MKHVSRKLLALVLAIATMSTMLTFAAAANTDRLTLTATPEEGLATIREKEKTTFSVEPEVMTNREVDVTDEYSFTYQWLLNGEKVSTKSYYSVAAGYDIETKGNSLVCVVTAKHGDDGTTKMGYVSWELTTKVMYNFTLAVNDKIGNYYFGSTSTESGSSIMNEICEALEITKTTDMTAYQVLFTPGSINIALFGGLTLCRLDEMDELYLAILKTGTYEMEYTVVHVGKEVLAGKITVEIRQYAGMDAFIEADPGENVVIPASEFHTFWTKKQSDLAELDSILISGVTGLNGTLCYAHTATESKHTNINGQVMYATSYGALQRNIKDLTFVPTKTANKYPTGAVKISFVANGRDEDGNSVAVPGVFVIFYNDKKADPIEYTCNGVQVLINGNDFDDVYRDMTGSVLKDPSYSVRFLNLPATGTLYRDYSSTGYGALVSSPLTKDNYESLTFSSTSTAENSLDKLAYVPVGNNPAGDIVKYLVYSGDKLLYVGELKFISKEVVVTYTTNTNVVNFSSKDFFTAGSPLVNAQYLVFGNPSSGALYKDYENKTAVQVHDYFSYNTTFGVGLLDNIVFEVKEDFMGVVEIRFNATSMTGGTVPGRVRIYVVKDVFDDVDPNNWAAPYINRLYATSIISGTSATTFSPNDNMNYGAALKMILLAAGCPKQSETGGTHWASSYLDYAFRKGYVSSRNVDLNQAVTREAIAELAAKVLGLEKTNRLNSGVIGPVDSTNGYVYALYNAGILNGSFVGGLNYFYGDQNITRAEVSKIICMINDYVQK